MHTLCDIAIVYIDLRLTAVERFPESNNLMGIVSDFRETQRSFDDGVLKRTCNIDCKIRIEIRCYIWHDQMTLFVRFSSAFIVIFCKALFSM